MADATARLLSIVRRAIRPWTSFGALVSLVVVLVAAGFTNSPSSPGLPVRPDLDAYRLPSVTGDVEPIHLRGEHGLAFRLSDPEVTITPTRRVIASFGAETVRKGLLLLNGAGGSRFKVTIDWSAPEGDELGFGADDGVNALMFRPEACGEKVGLTRGVFTGRTTDQVRYVSGGDIAICPDFDVKGRSRTATVLLAHEVGHVAGLGHVCPDREAAPCGKLDTPESAWGELMFPLAHFTQTSTARAGVTLARLYPKPGSVESDGLTDE